MRRLAFGIVALVVVLVALRTPAAQSRGEIYVRDSAGEMAGAGGGTLEGPGDSLETSRPDADAARSTRIKTLAATAPPYTFFPQAGTEGQDLFLANYVDLSNSAFDHNGAGLDFTCTDYSYAGHNGHDSIVDGFREQAIGVPVFAALNGTVYGVHDGEPDQQTVNLVGRPTNFVALAHAGGYETTYLHLKSGSITVTNGQTVAAGTQIGLTGSSGDSSWPHLHFTSSVNNVAYEPSAGKCRPGDSSWTNQPLFRRDTYVTSFTYGTQPFTGDANFPFDNVVRSGTFASNTRTMYFRVRLRNLPAQSTYRFVLVRPDGATVLDNSGSFANTDFFKHAWYWFSRNVILSATGTWTLTVYANDQVVATAPFAVVDASAPIVNQPPLPIRWLAIAPLAPTPADVPICRVTPGSIYRRDPDYDLVRYRYRWFLRETLIRDVTSAALSDAIPSSLLRQGDALRCEVTPMDDSLAGTTVSVAAGSRGQQLAAGDALLSENGYYQVAYQASGNLVLVDTRTRATLWSTNTANTTPGQLLMLEDGNLVLHDAGARPIWMSNTSGSPGAHFAIENDGNFVIYDADGKLIWDRSR